MLEPHGTLAAETVLCRGTDTVNMHIWECPRKKWRRSQVVCPEGAAAGGRRGQAEHTSLW